MGPVVVNQKGGKGGGKVIAQGAPKTVAKRKRSFTGQYLAAACQEMAQGLIDADLGDYLYKKRVAMPSKCSKLVYF